MGYRITKSGFTLFELMAVIAVLSLVLFFTIPKFQQVLLPNESKKFSRWLILKAQSLKERSLREQKTYILYADMDDGSFWMGDESMSEEQKREAQKTPEYKLSDNIRLVGVKYPTKGMVSAGSAPIRFHKNGYSDKVIIYLKDDEQEMSFLIEPFLSKVKYYDGYADFDG